MSIQACENLLFAWINIRRVRHMHSDNELFHTVFFNSLFLNQVNHALPNYMF